MEFPLLSIVLLAPLVMSLILCFLPRDAFKQIRVLSAGAMAVATVCTLFAFTNYDTTVGGIQFAEKIPWITDLGVSYYLGVDGISLPMVMLTNVIGLSAIFTSWNTEKRAKEYFILLLVFIAGVSGTFLACDLFIFLLCYEVVVIPIYIMILIWGSTKRVTKEYAGMKLTMFLMMSSGFMLVGIVMLYLGAFPAGQRTFDMQVLAEASRLGHMSGDFQTVVFFLLLLSFGSLLTMFPLHNWSPDGHAAAPSAISMIHAGVLKKIGGYGLIRLGILVLPLGAKYWAPLLAFLAMFTVMYAAYCAMVQRDLKYVIGFSSVSHLGYILLGIAALNVFSVTGAIANMVAHGIMSSLFFSQIGYIYEKTHLRSMPELNGLAHHFPRLTIGFMLAGMASVGLPGLISFVPEVTIFMGTIDTYPAFAVLAIAGIIFTALYVLRMLAKVLFGPRDEHFAKYQDEQGADMVPLILLGVFLIGFGLFPELLMRVVEAGVRPMAPIFESLADAPTLLGGGL